MSWSIPIAYQSRDQTTTEALEAGVDQKFEGEERSVFIELLFNPPDPRIRTMGELEDHFEGRDQDGRRRLLDEARKSAGLPTTGELDHAAEHRKMLRDDPPMPALQPTRDHLGQVVQECAAEGCRAMSRNAGGAIAPVRARKWWCELHAEQAEPGDLEDWEPATVQFDPLSGGLLFPEERALAAEHYARQAEQRDEEHHKRLEQRQAEAERIRILEEQRPEPPPAPGLDPYMALHRLR